MLLLLVVKFVAFPSRKDAIVRAPLSDMKGLKIEASGSIGLHYGGRCHQTYPNETLHSEEKFDWCSNIAGPNDNAWITYYFPSKSMKIKGYSVRNGCCWYACCCIDDNTDIYGCCCRLYSFSLLASNDNKTWVTLHKVEKDEKFWRCLFNTYEFPITTPYKYVRFQLDEPFPGCQRCLQINEFQIYGETIDSSFSDSENDIDNDESISIIGKIKHNSD